ncbi:MAG: hypothetical protein EOP83_10280 [Verrucomicrobiaceae bacterium]|nr:MAG: hypothetical protein EOP83_10280 [Verrucomicrobiaceae bacterium]
MYANKVNGKVFAGDFLGANLQFYAVTTSVDITGASASSQAALDKLVEVISLNGQPVIMGAPTGTGPYVLRFAVEHTNAWEDSAELVAAIKTHAPVQFAASTTTAAISEAL